jgi:hypothetical protein
VSGECAAGEAGDEHECADYQWEPAPERMCGWLVAGWLVGVLWGLVVVVRGAA